MKVRETCAGERGSALWYAVLLMLVVGSSFALRADRHAVLERDTRLELAQLQAFHAAEGALELARHHLARGEAPPAALRVGECEVVLDVQEAVGKSGEVRVAARALRTRAPRVSRTLLARCRVSASGR